MNKDLHPYYTRLTLKSDIIQKRKHFFHFFSIILFIICIQFKGWRPLEAVCKGDAVGDARYPCRGTISFREFLACPILDPRRDDTRVS